MRYNAPFLSVLIALWLITSTVSFAQPQRQYPFGQVNEFLKVEYGFHLACFAQDSAGLVWLGNSGGGILRTDSYTTTAIQHNPLDANGLGHDWVKGVAVDSGGNTWIGMVGFGLDQYDPYTEKYMHHRPDSGFLNQMPNFYVNDIRFLNERELLISVQGGNAIFDISVKQYKAVDWANYCPILAKEGYALSNQNVYIGEDQFLWFHAERNGNQYLLQWRKGEDSFFSVPLPEGLERFNIVRHLYANSKGQIWLELGGQLAYFNRKGPEEWAYYQPDTNLLRGKFIHDIKEIPYWVGHYFVITDQELALFEPATEQFASIHSWPDRMVTTSFGGVFDRDNNFWIDGRLKSSQNFFLLGPREISFRKKFTGTTLSFLELEKEEYLIGTARGFRLLKNNEIRSLNGPYASLDKYSRQAIYSLQWDKDGWIAFPIFSRHIFCRFNPQSGEVLEYPINSSAIFTFGQDRSGVFWLGTWRGLARLDIELDSLTIYQSEGPCDTCLHDNAIRVTYVSPSNQVWVGTTGGGLHRFDPVKEVFRNFQHEPGNFQSLSNNAIKCLLEDSQGRFWVGTKAGLNLLDRNTGLASWILKEDGLADNSLSSIIEDDRGQIWVASKEGLSKIDANEKASVVFDGEDGARIFTSRSAYKDSQGRLFFGMGNGFIYFHPDSLPQQSWEFPLRLSALKIKSEKVSTNTAPEILPHSLNDLDKIRLNHHQNFFSIAYTAVFYPSPEKVKYAYFLENLEDGWQYVGGKREATYTNVPPGNYTFRVKAENGQGVWSPHEASIQVVILPPWWWSWWSKTLYVLVFVGTIYGIYRFQLNRQLARAETRRLKELDEVKTRLYANITHEFRTPLTIILGMVDKLVENPKEWLSKGADMIRRNGQNLLRLVNQMLDLSKLESGKLQLNMVQGDVIPYLRYVVESFHSYGEIKDIRLHFHSEEEELIMDYDPDNLLNIVSNLLSNAVKFTKKGGDVYVRLSHKTDSGLSTANCLLLTVRDTGIGIPEDKLPHIFDRFYQADDSDTKQGEGTGIGLALTKELVKLMGGTINVKSKAGQGTVFSILLPIHNNAPIVAGLEKLEVKEEVKPFTHPRETDKVEIKVTLAGESEKPTALIVEDNADVVEYLVACLEGEYQLEVAYDGQEGIDKALELAPDIIISDVMMPEKGGYELCYSLKNDMRTSHIPIVLLTAKADVGSKITGLRQGADAYLAKPFNEEELQVRMNHLLELRRKLQQKYSGGEYLAGPPPKAAESETPLEDEFIRRFREVVEAHLDDYELDVSKLCRELGMSRAPLHNKLKALTGKSTTEFVRFIRLNRARELLLSTDLNISEVAYETGFRNHNYFTKMFGALFGMSPTEWREENSS